MSWYQEKRNGVVTYSLKKEWEFEQPKLIDDGKCPCATKKVKVVMSQESFDQCRILCEEYPELEWMAALIGQETKDGDTVYVQELKLMEQEVSGSTVELTDEGNVQFANTKNVGWIHSHNTMDVFLSPTDIKTAGQSRLSLCVNNAMKICGRARRSMGCGYDMLLDVNIQIHTDIDKKYREDFVKVAKEMIKKDDTKTGYHYSGTGVQVEADECVCCYQKVGKGGMTLMEGGKLHKKCKDDYNKELLEEMDNEEIEMLFKDSGYLNKDNFLEDLCLHVKSKINQCDGCQMEIDACICLEDQLDKYGRMSYVG